jgi:hypothetical protein
MFTAVCKLGLEGIVSKKLSSSYRSGNSKAWIQDTESEGTGVDAGEGWELLNSPFARRR